MLLLRDQQQGMFGEELFTCQVSKQYCQNESIYIYSSWIYWRYSVFNLLRRLRSI